AQIAPRAVVMQQKTKRPVQFEITDLTRRGRRRFGNDRADRSLTETFGRLRLRSRSGQLRWVERTSSHPRSGHSQRANPLAVVRTADFVLPQNLPYAPWTTTSPS